MPPHRSHVTRNALVLGDKGCKNPASPVLVTPPFLMVLSRSVESLGSQNPPHHRPPFGGGEEVGKHERDTKRTGPKLRTHTQPPLPYSVPEIQHTGRYSKFNFEIPFLRRISRSASSSLPPSLPISLSLS